MQKKLKYLIAVLGSLLLLSGQALACGGAKPCMAGNTGSQMNKDCPMKKDCPVKKDCPKGKGAACKGHGYSHAGKQHARIPGKSSSYVRRILRLGDEIGLSDTQRQQIEDILIAASKQSAEARARADSVAAELYGKLRSGGVDDAGISAYAERMGELYASRLKANLTASVRASSMLSAEQKKKLYAGKKTGDAKQ